MKRNEKSSFGYLITICNNQLIKSLNRNFSNSKIDLTREQFIVLRTLWENDTVNQQSIANILSKDKYSITKLIDGLEKRNLVKRVASKCDRRLKIIKLTSKSMNLKPKIESVADSTVKHALEGISKKDLEITVIVLSKIIENIEGNEV